MTESSRPDDVQNDPDDELDQDAEPTMTAPADDRPVGDPSVDEGGTEGTETDGS